jgi:hypothetical protein
VLLAVALSQPPAAPPVAADGVPAEGDLVTYERIIERMRAGEGYYPAAHEVLVADGYGTRSVFNWRTPAWPMLLAALPPGGGQMVLGILAGAALLSCYQLLRGPGLIVTSLSMVAVGLSLAGVLAPQSAVFSEVAAGILILLSVAAYGNGWRSVGLLAAFAALFLRELAAPYLLVCLVFILRARDWQKFTAYGALSVAYALYFAWHFTMVHAQIGPMDRAYAEGWVTFGGLEFVLATAGFNGLWSLFPAWLPAIFLPLGLLGLWAAPQPRAFAAVAAYVAAFLVIGKGFNAYWGALYTPLLMLGIGWSWPALRDLLKRSQSSSAAPADAPHSGS